MVRGAFKTMVTSITAGTDRFDMPQFMELCTLTSTPKGYSFAACPEDGCTATDLRRQVEFNGSKGSALQDRVQMPTKKETFGFRDTGPMSQSLLTELCLTTTPEDKSDAPHSACPICTL